MENHNCLKTDARPTDYIMGVSSPIKFEAVSTGVWIPRLHFFEKQKFSWETEGCVLFTAQESFDAQMDNLIVKNIIPTPLLNKFHDLGYMDVGFDGLPHFHSSPRFLQVLTGNGFNGNHLYDPWDVMRKYGVLPWKDLPYDDTITQADYLKPIPQPLLDKAANFLIMIGGKNAIQYHWIFQNASKDLPVMQTALQQAPLCLGVAVTDGWNQVTPSDPLPTAPSAHAVMNYDIDVLNCDILDHYVPFEKVLDNNYPIPHALQGILSPIPIPPPPVLPPNPTIPQEVNWLARLKQWLLGLLGGKVVAS